MFLESNYPMKMMKQKLLIRNNNLKENVLFFFVIENKIYVKRDEDGTHSKLAALFEPAAHFGIISGRSSLLAIESASIENRSANLTDCFTHITSNDVTFTPTT